VTAIIRTEKLTKNYGTHRGIADVDLEVQQGEMFGFLGPNGAGKTTTIRVLLDLIRPTSGKAYVFEIESSADPVAIHRRIGYLPGEFALYDRLTGRQTLEYFGNLRGGVDQAYQAQLIERFDLDPSRRFREYSKGNKQKVGLVAALQHRPELLLLDEPTSGLDPLVQQTFFGLLRERVKDGATVFLSSHILSEVERSCDRVAIIRDGRLVQVDRVDALRDLAHHQVELRFAGEPPVEEFKKLAGVSDLAVEDHLLRLRVFGPITPVVQAAARLGVTDFLSREPSLEETFLAQYGRESAEAPAAEAPAGEAPAGEVN
jgi:ABC-2 type transport system ATP-binding protein